MREDWSAINVASYKLILLGHVPAKKNQWKRARGGGIYFDRKETRPEIDSLVLQAKGQWRRDPARLPSIMATFYLTNSRCDVDNAYTTIQDVLVTAGVLKGDSIKHLPGPVGFRGVLRPGLREETVIEISEAA